MKNYEKTVKYQKTSKKNTFLPPEYKLSATGFAFSLLSEIFGEEFLVPVLQWPWFQWFHWFQ